MKIIPRKSTDRGHADHTWLKTFHTFSFAMYQDHEHQQFGALRVLNEDRVEPHTGFGTHGHREFEIFSYVVSGELEHRDSMGNVEVLRRGDVQLTSAGTGIRHSEKAHGPRQVHFLQIWTHPQKSGLTPKYFTRHFTDEEKKDKWTRVVAPAASPGVSPDREAPGPAPVQSPVSLFATLLSPSVSLPYVFPSTQALAPESVSVSAPASAAGAAQPKRRKAYVHVVQTSGYNSKAAEGAAVKIASGEGEGESAADLVLREGDGAYVFGDAEKRMIVENVGDRVAEVLLFETE